MNSTAQSMAVLQQATTWVLPVIFAVTFHEAAHGFVAYRFGDDTAARAGRMTLNPLSHVDPFGTVLLPALLFVTSGVPSGGMQWTAANLVHSIQLNAVLCVFNMLPFPPLDGGRVAVGILPRFLAFPLARVEPYGMMILLLIFVVSYAGAHSGLGFNLLGWLIGVPADALIQFVLLVTGQG